MIGKFVAGKKLNIAELDEETAVLLFGRPVYEAWKENKDKVSGTLRVQSICKETSTIELIPENEKGVSED